MLRRVIAVSLVAWLLVSCGSNADEVNSSGTGGSTTSSASSGDSPPQDATSFTYEVAYGDPAIAGEAEVIYTDADGQDVTEQVTMPWKSEPVTVSEGQSYRIEASAPARDDATFKCGINTDNGWNLGNSDPIGECSYTFPDDLEDDES